MTVTSSSDCDLISSFLDVGPLGTNLPVQFRIPYGLNPGSILFITARCENRMSISLKDDINNVLQTLEIKVNKNEIIIKDQSDINTELNDKTEVCKARCSLTIVCEPEGYRVFINGKQLEFFKRNYINNITLLDIFNCRVYKIIYTTIICDNKNKNGSSDIQTNTAINNASNIDNKTETGTISPESNEDDKENVDESASLPAAE